MRIEYARASEQVLHALVASSFLPPLYPLLQQLFRPPNAATGTLTATPLSGVDKALNHNVKEEDDAWGPRTVLFLAFLTRVCG